MDSLTHILTGAAIGQVFSTEKDRYRTLVWGAIAGSIPDLDAAIQLFLSPESSMLFHRGLSHSLLLWALCSPLLALLINRIYKGDRHSYFKWLKISATAWFSHLALDLFNTYGTGIFEPFSHVRIAFDAVNVFDLLFLIPVLTASVFFIFIIKDQDKKSTLALLVLLFSMSYMTFASLTKLITETNAKIALAKQSIYPDRLISSPLPLSTLAWKIVAEDDNGFYTGVYYGFWKDKIHFDYLEKNRDLEKDFRAYDNFQALKRFTKDWYFLEQKDEKFFLYDLRFSSLKQDESVLCFPLHANENSLAIGRASLNRHITFKNIKEHCKQLFNDEL